MKRGPVLLCVLLLLVTSPGCSTISTTAKKIQTAKELAEYLVRGERRQHSIDLISATEWVIRNGDDIVDTVGTAKDAVESLKRSGVKAFKNISVHLSDPKNAALKRKLTEFAGALFVVLLKVWAR